MDFSMSIKENGLIIYSCCLEIQEGGGYKQSLLPPEAINEVIPELQTEQNARC